MVQSFPNKLFRAASLGWGALFFNMFSKKSKSIGHQTDRSMDWPRWIGPYPADLDTYFCFPVAFGSFAEIAGTSRKLKTSNNMQQLECLDSLERQPVLSWKRHIVLYPLWVPFLDSQILFKTQGKRETNRQNGSFISILLLSFLLVILVCLSILFAPRYGALFAVSAYFVRSQKAWNERQGNAEISRNGPISSQRARWTSSVCTHSMGDVGMRWCITTRCGVAELQR